MSINYVAMSKDIGKRFPQLYYIRMKISYDLGFIAIGIAVQVSVLVSHWHCFKFHMHMHI